MTMAFSMMSQMLLEWRASMGCCLPSRVPRGRLQLLAASRLSWWMHMAPTWWSSWLITSPVPTVSSAESCGEERDRPSGFTQTRRGWEWILFMVAVVVVVVGYLWVL